MTKSPTSLILFVAIIFSMSLGLAYATGYGSIQAAAVNFKPMPKLGLGVTYPIPTPTKIGTSFPSPTPTSVGNTGPTNTLLGSDGTYCKDYGNSYRSTQGYCVDLKGIHYDYCSNDMARQFYCSGSWNGKSWTGVYCADGGYSCSSAKLKCSNGGCVDPKLILR